MTTPCFEIISEDKLNLMATKKLIDLMRFYDYNCPDYTHDCYWGNCKCQKACAALRREMVMRIYTILKTRPHIPNKAEAKKIRQERAAKKFKTISAR
jgi:hypothetical protein